MLSEGPRRRPAFLGISGLSPRAPSVQQLSWATRTVPEGMGVEQLSQATRAVVRVTGGSTCCPGRLGLGPVGPPCRSTLPGALVSGPRSRGQPAVQGDLGPCLISRWVDPLSLATQALVGGTTVSIRCPGQLGPVPQGPWCRPDILGDLGSGPRPRGRPAVLGALGTGPKALGVDQLTRVTRARIRGPAGSASCPR